MLDHAARSDDGPSRKTQALNLCDRIDDGKCGVHVLPGLNQIEWRRGCLAKKMRPFVDVVALRLEGLLKIRFGKVSYFRDEYRDKVGVSDGESGV